MSEIKFRLHTENKIVAYEAWNFFDLKWEYFDLNGNKINMPFHTGKNGCIWLKDKNGKEIFEGDIIKHKFGIEKVEIEQSEYIFECLPFNHYEIDEGRGLLPKDCIVIGNIYENPE